MASREEAENLLSDCINSLDRALVFSVLFWTHHLLLPEVFFKPYYFPCVLDFLIYISDKNNLRTSWWKEEENHADLGSSKDKIKLQRHIPSDLHPPSRKPISPFPVIHGPEQSVTILEPSQCNSLGKFHHNHTQRYMLWMPWAFLNPGKKTVKTVLLCLI